MAEYDSGGEPVRQRHSADYVTGGYCASCLGHSHGASNCPNTPKEKMDTQYVSCDELPLDVPSGTEIVVRHWCNSCGEMVIETLVKP